MTELHPSLLREKFVIHDAAGGAGAKNAVTALSNRIEAELAYDQGKITEKIVVRAQNMHSCVRMTARILQAFLSGGPLISRPSPFEWGAAWEGMLNDYEIAYNPQRWIAVYAGGKCVFEAGEHHPFLDVIEKCQAGNQGDYERAIPLAEDVFGKMGKTVRIDYDGNVALVVHLEEKQARFGVILRNPLKTATFNFSVTPKPGRSLNYPQCLNAAAAFLEGIQLAFMVGMNDEKIRIGMIARHSKEEKQTKEARQRLVRLNSEIATLEAAAEVRYRPERPEFQQIMTDAERLAKDMLRTKK